MSEKLRCPNCDVEAEAEFEGYDEAGEALLYWPEEYGIGSEIVSKPITCPGACQHEPVEMKVVRSCLTCAGSSRWKTAVSAVECECPTCGGTGEILEEQP